MAVWTEPVHVAAGNSAIAADVNAQILDNLVYLLRNLPSCRAYNNANLVIPNAATAITFNAERWDNGAASGAAMHSISSLTSHLIAPIAGEYRLWFGGEWATAPATCEAYFLINGTNIVGYQSLASTDKRFMLSTSWYFNAADYAEVILFPASSQTLNYTGATNHYSPEAGMHYVTGAV